MGAIFRMTVLECSLADMKSILRQHGLPLYGAALSDAAKDLRTVALDQRGYSPGAHSLVLASFS